MAQGLIHSPCILWNVGAFPCPPDFSRDGRLNVFDFLAFFNAYADEALRADFNQDGRIDHADFQAFQAAFAAGCDR